MLKLHSLSMAALAAGLALAVAVPVEAAGRGGFNGAVSGGFGRSGGGDGPGVQGGTRFGGPGRARPGRGFGGSRFYSGPRFRGDVGAWRGGNWYHGWHGGNFGWWWTIGPAWYWYDYPVYPYPVYPAYAPGPYYDEGYIPREDAGPPPPQVWYYCENSDGYYPYVTSCNGEWREVPVNPADANPTPPPPDDRDR